MSQNIDNEPTPPEHQPARNADNEEPTVIPPPAVVRNTEVVFDSQVAIPYKVWVRLFVKHPIMASKDVSSTANKAKKAARAAICSELKELYPHKEHTEIQVRKAFNNKRSLLLAIKVDANKTGNTPVTLSDDEQKFLDVINGPGASNLSINNMPGAVSSSQTSGSSSSGFCSPSPLPLCGTKRPAPPSPSHSPSPKRVKEDVTYLQQSVLKEQLIYFKTKNGTMQAAHEAEGSEMRSRVEQLENIIATMQCQISRLQETCGLNIQQGHQGAPSQSFLQHLMYDDTSHQHIN